MSEHKPRSFRIQQMIKSGAGEGIIEIPHPVAFQHRTPAQLIEQFTETWGVAPTGVVLPVTAPDGLLYECEGLGLPYSPYMERVATPFVFADVVKQFAPLVKKIYLLMDPTMHFVKTGALQLVDVVGVGSAQLCIGNARSRELIAAILGTGLDIVLPILKDTSCKLEGAVIDCVDIWPMGAKNERLELTCFCESCSRYFEEESPGLLDKLRTFPNPWNLALTDTGTGIGFIDNLPLGIEPARVVGLSRQRGYDRVFKDAPDAALYQLARDLLQYIEVRHRQTMESVHDIFDQAFQGLPEPPRRVVLTEGVQYDWTSGLQLGRLDSKNVGSGDVPPPDEVWFDPSSSDLFLEQTDFRSYMWRRSRYFIDAFLNTAATVSDKVKRTTSGIARLSDSEIHDLLRRRLRSAISTAESELTSLAALPKLRGSDGGGTQRVGFVGVALTEDVGEKFIRDIVIAESGANVESGPGDDERERIKKALRQLMQAPFQSEE